MKTSGETILVVEDNKTNRLIAKSLLEQEGFSIILADDGEKGVAAFLENSLEISLVLMDLHMPVLNGYDASLRIKEIASAVPIIALTADVVEAGQYDKAAKMVHKEKSSSGSIAA
ncbi:response regulator [Aminivibrio sp.]|jgi:CheY-like chemotaxis protein|uniref:response regulator n=1 Tax=Aminivibrio sp. TaxID=1872489 RepID=UPI001A594DB7|nr:response regulator [Aminivibrio sp.]MBL3539753.1 response regulator [Aminivibrio sp.]MDK2959661.1 hypothetical protein [Synergistaceae bacterium]